jgi:LacI family transcriptional regulator
MPTIRDIAKKARVSVGTVSKVLTNTPYVSDETRERILQVIAEVGYQPSFAGRALSRGRTYNIGAIFSHRGADRFFSDPYQITILQEVERIASEHEYNIVLSAPMIPVADAPQFQRLIRSGYLDGALTFEILPDSPLRPHLEQHNIPCIAVNYHPQTYKSNTVYVDDFAGAKEITAYALGMGHRRVGIVNVPPNTLAAWEHRMGGYRAALEDAGIENLPIVEGDFTIESGREAATHLVEHFQRCGTLPTLILCFNDRMALGAIQRLQAMGYRVPYDISVGGFDDIPMAQTTYPTLTTVRQPSDAIGAAAMDYLLQWIDTKAEQREYRDPDFEPCVIPSHLVIRESIVPPQK